MCPQEAISDVVSVPELPQVEQVEYSSEILEPGKNKSPSLLDILLI